MPAATQGLLLVAIDAVTNVSDYGFHVFLGRALSPGDFAAAQTVNMMLLVVATSFAVLQPVVARDVAAAASAGDGSTDTGHGFRDDFVRAAWIGLALTSAVWLVRDVLGSWLHVPQSAVTLGAASLLFVISRPIVAGTLQGQQRFVAFGLVRSAYAVGRLALCLVLVGFGGGLLSAIASYPLAALLALVVGLGFLGGRVWDGQARSEPGHVGSRWRSCTSALVAYASYMTMLGSDLIWVNRHFAPAVAAGYAAAVLFRRVLTVLPGIVLVVLYPKIVRAISQRQSPDGLLIIACVVVSVPTCLGTVAYFALGPTIVPMVFGSGYQGGELLGWMGVAILGFNLGGIWLNLFLATHPMPFLWLAGVLAAAQIGLLTAFHQSLSQVVLIFGAVGWLLGLGGLAIHILWLRPRLRAESA